MAFLPDNYYFARVLMEIVDELNADPEQRYSELYDRLKPGLEMRVRERAPRVEQNIAEERQMRFGTGVSRETHIYHTIDGYTSDKDTDDGIPF